MRKEERQGRGDERKKKSEKGRGRERGMKEIEVGKKRGEER